MPALKVDIAIVGAGVAGPALAAALRRADYDVALVEASETEPDTARGDHLQPVACELLERWGALGAFFAAGAEKRLGSKWLTAEGELLLDARVDELPLPHPYYLYLNHEKISEAFLELAGESELFTLLRPAKAALTVDEGDGRYALDVTARDGRRRRIEAALIVAADGRASQLRNAAGFAVEALNYETPFAIVFAKRSFDDVRNDLHAYVGQKGIVSVVPRTGGKWKIGLPIAKADLPRWKKSTVAERAQLVASYVPALGRLETELAGFYPAMMLRVGAWSKRNLVLLGDACHAMHPGRSQGMNTALKCIAALLERLPDSDGLADPKRLSAALAAYESATRPGIEKLLDENHRRGLEMDRIDPAETAALVRRLEAIGADPEKRRAYSWETTGYDHAPLNKKELVR